MGKMIIFVLVTALVSLHNMRDAEAVLPPITEQQTNDAALYYEYEDDDAGLDYIPKGGEELDEVYKDDVGLDNVYEVDGKQDNMQEEDVKLDSVSEEGRFDNVHEEDVDSIEHHRARRQAAAADLALDHDKGGKRRPVGKPHGFVGLDGSGNDRKNYHATVGAGVGAVAWRSRNNRHSVGVGATVDQHRGRFQGHRYRSKPNVGVGVGYKFRF